MFSHDENDSSAMIQNNKKNIKILLTLVVGLLRTNKETLQNLHLHIVHKMSCKDKPFTDLTSIENMNVGLIRVIASCHKLKNLTIPVFFYNPKVLDALSRMLSNFCFL